MDRQTVKSPQKYIFFLHAINPEAAHIAAEFLREQRMKVLNNQGNVALIALATADQVETAYLSGLFSSIHKQSIKPKHLVKLSPEQQEVAELWNYLQSSEFRKIQADRSQEGKSWAAEDKAPGPPAPLYEPEEFKRSLLEFLELEEEELKERYQVEKPIPLEGDAFVEYEERLRKTYDNPTIAYHLARIAFYLKPFYHGVLLELPVEFVDSFFLERVCWLMENEIAVGVVFVESAGKTGPKFTSSDRTKLRALIVDGLDWLAAEAPVGAHLTWVYDWQHTAISVANGTSSSTDDYWRNPGMGQVNFLGNTYTPDLSGLGVYRDDLRLHNDSSHAVVIFVSHYATDWYAKAFPSQRRFFITNRDNYGKWGINTVNRIAAHEMCHLFGAADEYTGSGTPCSTCASTHGCYSVPNGNCGSCARPQQDCIMEANHKRICAYTRGQIGWADLFVELTTADVLWAGTDDMVWLDIGDRVYYLDTPNHNDHERNNVEGYALPYTGVTKNDIKRVGIRKSPDGFAGGWSLKRVRLWLKGDLICDTNNINQWLEDEYRWWVCTTCGSSNQIVNKLRVKVTTADVMWAGTDDDVSIHLGGRSWDLDNSGHNDFERNNTDTFDLDPGPSLYKSMLSSIHIHKSSDGLAGGWKLKGLEIIVNGATIYNKQNINKWLEDDDRDWYGSIP
jgi:hypothetical protein